MTVDSAEYTASFKTHPQAHIIISDLENLVGADWNYSHNGHLIKVGGTAMKPHEIMAFCDGIRYQRKIMLAKLEDLIS
jgi:hypothetical protein